MTTVKILVAEHKLTAERKSAYDELKWKSNLQMTNLNYWKDQTNRLYTYDELLCRSAQKKINL